VPDFDTVFEEHASFVWRVLRRYGVPERELADACQEVFLVVHRRLEEFEGRASLRTWLYAIAQRTALATRRRARFHREQLDGELPETSAEATQLDDAVRKQQLVRVEAALRELPSEQREVFALYELEGMTMAEVAATQCVPENTALYRLYAARDAIRQQLARQSGARIVRARRSS
jgi:RNA polymerase sigma-70 factor, ECF subfamily